MPNSLSCVDQANIKKICKTKQKIIIKEIMYCTMSRTCDFFCYYSVQFVSLAGCVYTMSTRKFSNTKVAFCLGL